MIYEEWKAQNLLITKRLEYIASRTESMAWLKTAHSGNPEFDALMDAQTQLIEAADRLIEKYLREQTD